MASTTDMLGKLLAGHPAAEQANINIKAQSADDVPECDDKLELTHQLQQQPTHDLKLAMEQALSERLQLQEIPD